MKVIAFLISLIGVICLLCYSVSAIDVPTVRMPSESIPVLSGSTETTVDLYLPQTPCYECMPEPTPAPVYETIGLTTAVSSTKVRMNSKITFTGNQVSGTPVLSTATWDWIIQPPKRTGYSMKGPVVSVKAISFGRWHVNLNVRDSVQMLNGHVTSDFNIVEKR